MPDIFNRKDFLLTFLFSPGCSNQVNEEIAGRTRITKAIFLFKKEIWKEWRFESLFPVLPDFTAWKYGPYSSDVFADLEFFVKIGFIISSEAPETVVPTIEAAEEYERFEEDGSDIEEEISEYTEEVFKLSDLGMRYVRERGLYESLSDHQRQTLSAFKCKVVNITLKDLLRYVYGKYPEQTSKSVIKDAIN
jgi:uncharacterized protein YwgA